MTQEVQSINPKDFFIEPPKIPNPKKLVYGDDVYILESEHDKALQLAEIDAEIRGMQNAKNRVLRRTEIPSDAKNPTRDATVYLGEAIADIIQADIESLTAQRKALTEKGEV